MYEETHQGHVACLLALMFKWAHYWHHQIVSVFSSYQIFPLARNVNEISQHPNHRVMNHDDETTSCPPLQMNANSEQV